MENKKNTTSGQNEFHGNQNVDSQGKQKNSTQNTGGSQKTGGKSTGTQGGNHGNQYVDSDGNPRKSK